MSTFLAQRKLIAKVTSGLSAEQLVTVPDCRSNNVLWNLGHLLVAQQGMAYTLSGLPMKAPESYKAFFGKGTSPADWSDDGPDPQAVLDSVVPLAEEFERDLEAGIFQNYQPYSTAVGVDLGSIDDAVAFNNFHEGLHFGIILAILKELG